MAEEKSAPVRRRRTPLAGESDAGAASAASVTCSGTAALPRAAGRA